MPPSDPTSSSWPLVSIVMPAYNHARFVTQGLDSVLLNDYPNKEIVIINDGSTDDTLEKIRAWADLHGDKIKITIVSRPNKGICATLNEAIEMARGDFILPIASDDYLLQGGIEKRVRYLLDHPELLAVFGDCITVNDDNELLYQSTLRDFHHTNTARYKTPRGVAFGIVWHWAIPGPVLLARRTLFSTIGGYDETRKIEDWDFFLRMAAKETLGFIDTPVAAYRLHTANTCRVKGRQAFILRELSQSGMNRAPLFKNKLYRLIVHAKALYYALKIPYCVLRGK